MFVCTATVFCGAQTAAISVYFQKEHHVSSDLGCLVVQGPCRTRSSTGCSLPPWPAWRGRSRPWAGWLLFKLLTNRQTRILASVFQRPFQHVSNARPGSTGLSAAATWPGLCLASLRGHQTPERDSGPLLFSLTETERHFLLVTYF